MRRGNGQLLSYSTEELVARWEEFLDETDLSGRITKLADAYPEERSLHVDYGAIDRFDSDLAIYLLDHPQNAVYSVEQAIRSFVPPTEQAEIRFRVTGVPRDLRVEVRDLRAKHLGKLVSVEGLVRKATEVRPRLVEAVFQCLRCGAVIKEAQEGLEYHEPLECYEDQGGCGRTTSATKLKLLDESSRYIDTQKIEIQEPPEELRGGEAPQRLAGYLEEDLVGLVNPGDRIVFNGVLRGSQRGRFRSKSTLFDIFLNVVGLELEQVEYEEIEITPEDEERIKQEAASGDIIRKIVGSIAPSIYGLTMEKEALALQLFGGVAKKLPDGRRIRGDSHILLIGDPGCLIGDERIALGNGTTARLEDLGRYHLQPISEKLRLGAGSYRSGLATRFHRYENQPILEVVTESGKSIKGTHNHPLLVWNPKKREGEWRRLDALRVGDRLRVTPSIKCWKRALVRTGWKEPKYHHRSWHVQVPEFVDEKLAAILGYVLGDGWIQERRVGFVIATEEMELEPPLVGLFEEVFGVTPNRQKARHHTVYYQVDRTPIARWLQGLRVKRVPDSILKSRNSVVSSFLRWLYEADGSCFAGGRGRTAISLRSSEIELLRDVQVLLLRWGIHSRVLWGDAPRPHRSPRGDLIRGGPNGSLVIRQANSIIKFAERIGFASQKKGTRLEAVVRVAEHRSRRWHPHLTERIVSIQAAGVETVYDVEVPGPERFIANGIISHNTAKSELLTYIVKLSPRGIYTSGKAATPAGLVAAAVRDEFGEGRWTLEAGALVLGDRGLVAIDEIEKMSDQDRSSIHNAMEQQTVHIAKAGITATLQTRTSILAAANPTFGRFDSGKYISEQIQLPPTLLSRFDSIFPILDKPQAQVDRAMAEHILRGHLAGEKIRQAEAHPLEALPEEVDETFLPYFEPSFLRKYVAYAKRIYPVLTPEAMQVIQDKYLEIRKQGEGEAGTVPITPRQLEAFIRIAEASARARLSPKVEEVDAERSVHIVEYWLERVTGVEGGFDIDIVATGLSQSQRAQMIALREIIGELAERDGAADLKDLLEAAEERGVPPNRVEAWLKRWSQEGEVYSPAPNKWRLVSRF